MLAPDGGAVYTICENGIGPFPVAGMGSVRLFAAHMLAAIMLESSLAEFRKLKKLAARAIAQVRDEDLFATLDPESNSPAVIMKQLAGNMRSR